MALALALEDPEKVAGLVLLSGFYYPVQRSCTNALAPFGFPIVDEVFRRTALLFGGHLMASNAVRRVFAPCAVPERFKRLYSIPHALRPSQIKAVAPLHQLTGQSTTEMRTAVTNAGGIDVLVVDHYGIDTEWEKDLVPVAPAS